MNSNRKTAITVGALFLISNVVFILGAIVFIEPILGAPDYLALASANRTQVILGLLLELINGIAYLGIAVFMYPILSQHFASMALGYVCFRIIEFVMQILADLSPLILLTLSEEFVRAGAPVSSAYQTSGIVLMAERYWAFQMVSITFGLGALLFYTMLYQTKYIPRFISIWGIIGAISVLANSVLEIFGLPSGNLGVIMLLNELFLGVWLIVKGFNPSSIASVSPNEGMVKV
jgi:Domain of unknown function (DUF4386)